MNEIDNNAIVKYKEFLKIYKDKIIERNNVIKSHYLKQIIGFSRTKKYFRKGVKKGDGKPIAIN